MKREEVEARIKLIIAEELLGKWRDQDLDGFLEESKIQIIDDTHLVNDLGADSLDTAELAIELEEEFDIVISDGELEEIHTFGEFVDAVCRKIS